MLDIFAHIYDIIFPPNESIKRLRNESRDNFVRHFSSHKFANCIALSDYTNPYIKAAITANKFHDSNKAATLLSALIEHWLRTLPDKPTIFVPIPLSSARLKQRGYNQVTRILESSTLTNLKIKELLVRIKETKPQTTLKRAERIKNIKDAFQFREQQIDSSIKRIIIVDDVVTTGATILDARKTLSFHIPKDCEIICLALAH